MLNSTNFSHLVAFCSLKLGPKEEDDGADVPRCRGRTRREEQCSFRPKSGSLYCERHTRQVREKGSSDYDMNYDGPSSSSPSATLSASLSLRSRRSSQEVVIHMADSVNTRERKRLSKAKDLFTEIMNAGLLRGNGKCRFTLLYQGIFAYFSCGINGNYG